MKTSKEEAASRPLAKAEMPADGPRLVLLSEWLFFSR